jgi:cytochrome c biogenesis protein CcmG, thiol:disulfide interchange protein DsbE
MIHDPEPRANDEAPALADDPEDAATDHGRVGYGRIGRYSPLALGILLALVVGGIWWTQRDAMPGAVSLGEMAGEPAPDVTLTLLDGSPLRLSDLRGNVVVVNFWASWCEPCRAESPLLERWHKRLADRGGTVLGVDVLDVASDAREFAQKYRLTYPLVRDGDGNVLGKWGVVAYPETFVIDRRGRIAAIRRGPVDEQFLRRHLPLLLEEEA